jgi:hypothetical protein
MKTIKHKVGKQMSGGGGEMSEKTQDWQTGRRAEGAPMQTLCALKRPENETESARDCLSIDRSYSHLSL